MWRVSGYRDRAIASGGECAFLQRFGIELSHGQSFGNKLLGQNFTRSDGDRVFTLTDKVQELAVVAAQRDILGGKKLLDIVLA